MNKDREKYIKENCYFLYDDVQNRYKSINEIQQNFKCQIDQKGN